MGFEIPPKAVARLAAMSGPKAAAVAAGIPWCDGHDCPREEQPDGAFLCPRCVSAATPKAEPQPETLFGVTEDPQTGDTKITLPSPQRNEIGKFHGPDGGAPETERQAAIRQWPKTGTDRRRVLDYVASCGPRGATDEETSITLGMRLYTAAPRRNELVTDGWLEDSGKRRDTTTGAAATVWRLTDDGVRQWRPAT